MENSLLVIFGEIWPKTMYYSTGSLARFWSNFKNYDTVIDTFGSCFPLPTNCTGGSRGGTSDLVDPE